MAVTDFIKTENGVQYIPDIDYIHPMYTKYAPLWQKARDIIMGEDELKSHGKREKYLARLGGHDYSDEGNKEYNAFVSYAMLYNATGRTVDAYRGLLNRKLPAVNIPQEFLSMLQDFTIKGESIYTFIEQLEVEIITTNRVGVFIDYPRTDGVTLSLADVRAKNFHPYATMYSAESIINWEESRINNKMVTSLVVLKESTYRRTTSIAPSELITYRILELDEDGYYRQIVVEEQEKMMRNMPTKYNTVVSITYPKQNGKYMTYIPFYCVTAQGVTWDLSKSVIDDLINVNLAHYRDTAFHEKAIAWTASPTPVFSGIPDDVASIAIGSSQAVCIQQGGTAKYLEYEGQGLDAIASALNSKENLMAILGAKILANTANGIESGEAALIHRAGEQGILADIATTVGGVLEKAVRLILRWQGADIADSDVAVDITKDYAPIIMDANTIIALGNEVDRGNLSYETYFWALQRGEVAPPTRTSEEERNLINAKKKGTIVGKDSKVTYLYKTDVNSIMGREDELIEQKKKPTTEPAIPVEPEED